MKHARKDYARFQEPTEFIRLIRELNKEIGENKNLFEVNDDEIRSHMESLVKIADSLDVREGSPIGDDEPIFILRGQDKLMVPILLLYTQYIGEHIGESAFYNKMVEFTEEVQRWQKLNGCKFPDIPEGV